MKKFFYLLFSAIVLISCDNGTEVKTEAQNMEEKLPDHIEVPYSHGVQCCITCQTIGTNVVAPLNGLYSKEQAGDRIIYKAIDISKKENGQIANRYEATWLSLLMNGWEDGKEDVNNMTELGFSNVRKSPDKFKEEVKNKVDELSKQLWGRFSSIAIRQQFCPRYNSLYFKNFSSNQSVSFGH